MRMIVFFDLPTVTQQERKEYIRFRKFLLVEGFIMMQQSIYTKILLNSTSSNLMKKKITKNKPKEGLVQLLVITEKQFENIEYICGESQKVVIDSAERLIIL